MRALAVLSCIWALAIPVPASGQAAKPPAPATSPGVQPEALAALKRMSDYLTGLRTFELVSNSVLDLVTVNGQRLQIDGVVRYKVARPGIWVDFDTSLKHRQYFYDGKQFTVYAPKLGFYASMPAPPTNREFLKAVYEKTGISLPLEDLFRWNDGDDSDLRELTWGFNVGTARIDGVETDHWAFRQGDYDWEVWIRQGKEPLPLKLVIVDRTDPAMPGYSARLKWTPNPGLTKADFTFVPGADAKRIQLATLADDAQ